LPDRHIALHKHSRKVNQQCYLKCVITKQPVRTLVKNAQKQVPTIYSFERNLLYKEVRFIYLRPKVRTGAAIATNIIEHRGLILFEPAGPIRTRAS
jgi:hypothetical protein